VNLNFTNSTLNEEIEAEEKRLAKEGDGSIEKEAMLNGLIGRHPGVYGPDADFAHYCIFQHLSKAVNRYFNEIKKSEKKPSSQAVLDPSWECLQKKYMIEREYEIADGNTVRVVLRSVAVPVERMSKQELLAKAEEHDSQGKGHFRHSAEIRRYAELQYPDEEIGEPDA